MLIKILLIDDEYHQPLMRECMEHLKRAVESLGSNDSLEWNPGLDSTIDVKSAVDRLRASKRNAEKEVYDIILLDVEGVLPDHLSDWSQEIEKLRFHEPYVPIIFFSNNWEVNRAAVSIMDVDGAGWIAKDSIRPPLRGGGTAAPTKQAASRLVRLAKKYQPIKNQLYKTATRGQVRKIGRVTPDGDGDIYQGRILEQIQSLEWCAKKDDLAPFLPKIAGKDLKPVDGWYSYTMPEYNWPSLSSQIIESDESNKDVILDKAKRILDQVIQVMFVYRDHTTMQTEGIDEYLEENCFGKLDVRLKKCLNDIHTRERTLEGVALERLLTEESILISGKEHLNPFHFMKRSSTVRNLVRPPGLVGAHGDLHFENILAFAELPEAIKVKLLDPKGARKGPAMVDFCFDIGKLFFSSNGFYDLIHQEYYHFELNIPDNKHFQLDGPEWTKWRTKKVTGGISGDRVELQENCNKSISAEIFKCLYEYIRTRFDERLKSTDQTWFQRARFYEVLHFLTGFPLHLNESPARALSLYLRGVQRMQEFIDDFYDQPGDGTA